MTDAAPLHRIEERVVDGIPCREFDVVANGRTVPGAWWEGQRGRPLVCFGHGASADRHQTPIPDDELVPRYLDGDTLPRHSAFAAPGGASPPVKGGVS